VGDKLLLNFERIALATIGAELLIQWTSKKPSDCKCILSPMILKGNQMH